MGHLRRRRGHRMPQGSAWSGVAGLGRCTMSGSWSGQPQVWLKRTRVQTCRAWVAFGTGRLARRMGRTTLGRMSDPSPPAGGPTLSGHSPYDRPTRQAVDEMPAEVRAAWRNRYLAEAEATSGAGPARPRRGGTPLRRHAANDLDAVDRACRPGREVGGCRSAGCCRPGWHGDGIAGLLTGLRDHIGKDRARRQMGSVAPALSPSRGDQDLLDPDGVAPE